MILSSTSFAAAASLAAPLLGRSSQAPSPFLLEQIHHLQIPITLSSDAHKPGELDGYFDQTLNMLEDIGFRELLYFREDGWKKQRI